MDLVLVSCLYDFMCPDAQTILQTKGGARVFYKPDKEWLTVLPINHILGRVPLMKAYLRGSMSPTILASFAPQKQAHFKHGPSDRNQDQIHLDFFALIRVLECTAKKEFRFPIPQFTPMSFIGHVEPSKGDVCVFLLWD